MVITSILLAAAVAAGNLQNAADVTLGATATFDGAIWKQNLLRNQ